MTGTEPRVAVVEGARVLVVERKPPIPLSLAVLIDGGRDDTGRLYAPLRIANRRPIRLGGARPECLRQDHRLAEWLEGFQTGADGETRYLSLNACADCGAVCVRDRSFDSLDNLRSGRRPLRRRDLILGWYSGARRNQRVYT